MEPWKLVLSEAAFQFFNGLRATERRKMLDAFELLKRDPRRPQTLELEMVRAGPSLGLLSGRFLSPTGLMISYWKFV
jgi:hypothetical protein